VIREYVKRNLATSTHYASRITFHLSLFMKIGVISDTARFS